MTSRRASGIGGRLRRIAAGARFNVWSTLLAVTVATSLLFAARAAHAGTRSTHIHRAPAQSAGKAPAHAVHDADIHAGVHPARAYGKASSLHAARTERSGYSQREERVSAKPRKGPPVSKHARNNAGRNDAGKHIAKAHSGHKRHGDRYQQQPADDPQPVHRAASGERRKRNEPQQLSWTQISHDTPSRTQPPDSQAAPPLAFKAALPERSGIPGNVARNMARRTGMQDDAAPSSMGVPGTAAVPDASTQARKPAPGPLAIVTAAPDPAAPLGSEVISGFGAEVGVRTAARQVAPTSSAPRESAAQQQRELREAAEVASQPMFVPLVSRDGKLVVPPPLKGSRDILVHQNQMADDAGLSRIQDDADLARMRRAHLLVDFEESASLHINENLPDNRRSARPWAVKFASDTARAFYQRFGNALQVNSAVRTVAYQIRLQRVNGNAAAADGVGASPHLTGQAIDFGKRGMSVAEIAWMRSYLMPLIEAGKIDVEEEFQQACFHISVYATYMPAQRKHAPARTEVAEVTHTVHARAVTPGADEDDNMR